MFSRHTHARCAQGILCATAQGPWPGTKRYTSDHFPVTARKAGCAEGDRRAEAQPYKGMSQTKVKSRMYASKFPTERSPVAKCVMIAEANTDVPLPPRVGGREKGKVRNAETELTGKNRIIYVQQPKKGRKP